MSSPVVSAPVASGAVARRETGDDCTLVLVGALGDLARRKLYPALYRLAVDGLLSPRFRLVGVERLPHDDASYAKAIGEALASATDTGGPVDPAAFERLTRGVRYVRGDLTDASLYGTLCATLESIESTVPTDSRNRLFYLAIPPSLFLRVVEGLSSCGAAPRTHTAEEAQQGPWTRLIIEKPFGRDLASARALNTALLTRFSEPQLYRIDHYLGKETVQNILAFRFANAIFEPLWNRGSIAHIQITVAETVGVEGRGGYYEEAGVLRDMFQNHLMQLLATTAMEPPGTMSAAAVRDEKVKLLRAVRHFDAVSIAENLALGQYGTGSIDGTPVPAYAAEPSVKPDSRTPTFAALRVFVDNWRWEGVPFYLRSGKRLADRVSEIVIRFRRAPGVLWPAAERDTMRPNQLALRIQPDEGITLGFQAKRPGAELALSPEMELAPVSMRFSYERDFGGQPVPAYETLLLDAMIGDATLFARSDEVEQAWTIVDPLAAAADAGPRPELYAAGTSGPPSAADLLARDGFAWHPLTLAAAGR
ncbi:MAG: glucose-6-phosphate dehydrogenase [Gemmatimonadaceae bacterium]|nr:glucose-6-phosphate dehydrogenase [Gemmatimonadaceae bacterium]